MTRQQTRRALLEPDAVKVACPVLRRAQRREALGLSDLCSHQPWLPLRAAEDSKQ